MNREPLTKEAIFAAAGSMLITGAAVWGLPLTPEQTAWLQGLVSLGVAGWIVWRVRPQVTPVSDPRDADGVPLVPDAAP